MAQNQILKEYVKKYALGGNASLIVENTRTEEQRRFRIKSFQGKFNVFDLDNKFKGYLGWIDTSTTNFSKISEANLAKNFSWIWKLIVLGEVPEYINFYHLGACSICGRPLKDAISLDRGIGPECWKNLQLTSKQ